MNTFKEHVVNTLRVLADQVERGLIVCYSWSPRNEADEFTGEVTNIILRAKFNVDAYNVTADDSDDDGNYAVVEKLNDLLKNKEVEVNGD